MNDTVLDQCTTALRDISVTFSIGHVHSAAGATIEVLGLGREVQLGSQAEVLVEPPIAAEVIRIEADKVILLCESAPDGVRVGDLVKLYPTSYFRPDPSWVGRVIDPDGAPLDGRPIFPGTQEVSLSASPPAPHARRAMGDRISTGMALFDTMLPIARGQRLGLFAGSGVGKSTLMADFAKGVDADIIVIGLVGERGREVREFVENVLGPEGLNKSVVVAATSDRAPQIRRRCAWSAMAVAEYFRDQGFHVLLLMDSVTRFAEAHREICIASGETANLRGFPASIGAALSSLCERAGPGCAQHGDITAVFSVLVAGSDMEEPVADMLRGILDGHIVLDRDIAERGRFPAVNLLQSTSRCLPGVASDRENQLIGMTRKILGAYENAELMVQSGLYAEGSDPRVDQAVVHQPMLDDFMTLRRQNVEQSFAALRQSLPTKIDGPR